MGVVQRQPGLLDSILDPILSIIALPTLGDDSPGATVTAAATQASPTTHARSDPGPAGPRTVNQRTQNTEGDSSPSTTARSAGFTLTGNGQSNLVSSSSLSDMTTPTSDSTKTTISSFRAAVTTLSTVSTESATAAAASHPGHHLSGGNLAAIVFICLCIPFFIVVLTRRSRKKGPQRHSWWGRRRNRRNWVNDRALGRTSLATWTTFSKRSSFATIYMSEVPDGMSERYGPGRNTMSEARHGRQSLFSQETDSPQSEAHNIRHSPYTYGSASSRLSDT
ncbi:hypothetical protein C8J56DRAFT_1157876 [Mycena floridula]|nr:hypothetical protein C8J56DRAFT_1157876 [Mycena floridula]